MHTIKKKKKKVHKAKGGIQNNSLHCTHNQERRGGPHRLHFLLVRPST